MLDCYFRMLTQLQFSCNSLSPRAVEPFTVFHGLKNKTMNKRKRVVRFYIKPVLLDDSESWKCELKMISPFAIVSM